MPELVANKPLSRPVPARIGKYEIINEIGKGTTGDVYLSHDPYYGRDVAIKVYHADTDADTKASAVARKMFFNEAQIVGKLQHPNILPIYDAGEDANRYYVVMEHVQGARTLASYCKPDNLLRIDDVVEIVFKCAKALHYAHSRGLIHRDIKPSNIMLTPGNDVRIIDFGIALLNDGELSAIKGIAGSPSYMSPEQVQSHDLTRSSDLYALGAVMYELLTGFRPFRAKVLAKLLNEIVFATPQPIHSLRQDVPEELEEVVVRAMQKSPEARYASCAEFAADLTRVYQAIAEKRQESSGEKQQFSILRHLSFFHEFSHSEIRELMRASEWREVQTGDAIVREGEIDDRFFIIVDGACSVESSDKEVGQLTAGNCFGESSYVSGSKRTTTVKARSQRVAVLSVSATLLEQLSTECQLRFNKVFLATLIRRLQGDGTATN
jgi:serine/threonine protein kinase